MNDCNILIINDDITGDKLFDLLSSDANLLDRLPDLSFDEIVIREDKLSEHLNKLGYSDSTIKQVFDLLRQLIITTYGENVFENDYKFYKYDPNDDQFIYMHHTQLAEVTDDE